MTRLNLRWWTGSWLPFCKFWICPNVELENSILTTKLLVCSAYIPVHNWVEQVNLFPPWPVPSPESSPQLQNDSLILPNYQNRCKSPLFRLTCHISWVLDMLCWYCIFVLQFYWAISLCYKKSYSLHTLSSSFLDLVHFCAQALGLARRSMLFCFLPSAGASWMAITVEIVFINCKIKGVVVPLLHIS